MDNEDKVERQSAGKKEKENKIHKRQGYVSAEIWWIASTPPTHPTQQAQKMHSSPSLWGRTQCSAYWMKQDQLEIYFQCKTHTFFIIFYFFPRTRHCWVALCALAVANTTRSGWELEGWKKDVKSRSAPLPSCVGFHEGRRCTEVIVIQI